MNAMNKLLIQLNLKFEGKFFSNVNIGGDYIKNKNKLNENDFNSSYYGDPYSYDWYCAENKNL